MPHPAFLLARGALVAALRNPSSTPAALEEAAFFIGVSEESIRLLMLDTTSTMGSPLCGGPAKIKHVDVALADQLAGFPSLLALEAEWIGTTTGLYYVTSRAGNVLGWTWRRDIAGMTEGRRIWKFGGVRVTASTGRFDLRTSASLVEVLMAMAERFVGGPEPASSPASRMSHAAEPMYRIQRAPEPIDPNGDGVCVTFKRLGADADPEDIIRRKLSRAEYESAILGNMIKGHDLGGTNWFEHEVYRLPPCG